MKDIKLRELQKREIAGFIMDMYRPYIEELKPYGGGSGMATPDLVNDIVNKHLAVYIIEENSITAGFILTEPVGEAELYRPMLFISEFYVRPKYRKQGVGAAAFRTLLDKTSTPLFWTVLPKNIPAVKFWQKILRENPILPIKPDPGQIEFAGKSTLYCVEQRLAV